MKKIVALPIDMKAMGQALFSSLVMGIAVYFTKINLELSNFAIVTISIWNGFLVYIVINYIFRNEILIQSLKLVKERIKR